MGKTLLKPPPARQPEKEQYLVQSEFYSAPISNRSLPSSRSEVEYAHTGRSTSRSEYGGGNITLSSKYMGTLQNLDRTFNNSDRRDLFAASMPGRSAQELVWCAANNSRGALQSKGWAQRLRKESTTQGL